MIRAALLLACALLAVALGGTARAQGAPPPAGADSLSLFLKSLGDSTDATYGAQSVAFDTTGLDSLAAGALAHPPRIPRRRQGGSLTPLSRFHRAEGWVLGLRTRVGAPRPGWLGLSGAYGFGDHLGRYDFDYRRTLYASASAPGARRGEPGTIDDGVTRLDLTLRYERSTAAVMPEHSLMALSSIAAWGGGRNRQNVYETRGGTAALTLWAGDFRVDAGVRRAVDDAMPRVTDWSLFGPRQGAPANALAAHDRYTEPIGSLAFARPDWQCAAVIDARGGGTDRWRLRGVLGKSLRVGRTIKAFAQVEGGAAAARAPLQRRFELGGTLALPSLPYGVGDTDHLVLGKLELVGSGDALRAVGVHPPDWLVLQPYAFAEAGAVWNDVGGRDVVFARVPKDAWRGSAGAGLAYRLGIPDPNALARLFVAWPVGQDAGTARFGLSLGTTFDLVGRR